MANSKRYGRPTDYTPEACDHVVALMGTGRSLTAAASAMGISILTIHQWMDQHEEFRDAVSRGKAARVLALEGQMLASENAAVISARRLALLNAAPEEWREKPVVHTPEDSPIRLLARQLMGTALRPRMPEPKTIIEHEPVAPSVIQPQQSITLDDAEDDEPRLHTISRASYDDEGSEGI